jgi:hypothetical protein
MSVDVEYAKRPVSTMAPYRVLYVDGEPPALSAILILRYDDDEAELVAAPIVRSTTYSPRPILDECIE